MNTLFTLLDDPRMQTWFPMGLFAVSVGSLAFAFHAQFVMGLEPCILCIYQRIPFVIVGTLAATALIRRDAGLRRVVVIVSAFAFAAGSAIAVYHVGVEQHWWASAVCGGKVAQQMSAADLLSALKAPPEKSCDDVDWTFLGLSMATYNVVFSGASAGLCLTMARRMKPTQ